MSGRFVESLNLKKTCAEYRVGLWQCPQFLFLVMGIVIIVAILVTYVVASQYQDPSVAALTVLGLAAVLFIIGNLIVSAFEKVALASRSKSEFISIMSHQLRSPLSAVKWQVDFLLSGGGQTPSAGSLQKYLQTVYDQNERMIRLVNDLLEVNRIEDDDLILRPAPFAILATTQKIARDYGGLAAASKIEIKISAPEGNPPEALADEERVRHVIEHLVDNAIRYSQNGGEVDISISRKNGEILWQIADHGSGIDRKDQLRIFEKFFRTDHALRYQTEGSGVGLFIAKAIIKKSGGEIGFDSRPNEGSTFWFTLPAAGITGK